MSVLRRAAGQRSVRAFVGVESLEGRALAAAGGHAGALGVVRAADTAGAVAGGVRMIPNVVYTDHGMAPQHLDLYLPTGPAPAGGRPVILALPGGGWRWVRRSDLGATVGSLARDGYVVAVADYAFASAQPGTHVWPTNFEDVQQAVRWLRTNAGRYGINPNEVAVWGESAGAHLANLLGTDPNGPAGAPASAVSARVQAVIDFYGPTDLARLYQESLTDRPYLQTFLGGSPDQAPAWYADASPIDHVAPGDPPFLIFQGSADTANLPDQSVSFAQALAKAGVPVRLDYEIGLPHGFRLRPGHGVDFLPEILDFLNSALGRTATS